VDIAGAEKKTFSMAAYKPTFRRAREAGLGITVHTGEAGSLKEMWFVVSEIKPDRIGHGVLAYKDKKLMQAIAKQGIVLEICPTSNLRNSVIKDVREMKKIYRTLLKNGIRLTINTDGPEMYRTHIIKEQEFLIKNSIFTQKEIDQFTSWAFEASFIK
jgi:adenosine deaminase